MKPWHYALIVFLGGCCYGLLSTFVKFAYEAGFSTFEVTGGQYLFGTAIAWILFLFAKKKKLTMKQIITLLLAGIPFGLTSLFYYQSLQRIDASLAIIFLFQFVWIGAIFDWLFYKKKPTRQKLVSISILLVGSFLAANVISYGESAPSLQGMLWGMLAAISFTSSLFLSGSVAKDTPAVQKSALLSTGAMIVIFALFPPTFLFNFDVLSGVAPYGILLGLFGVALPPILFSIGMPHVGPGLGSILVASELPVAVTMSAFVLLEHVSWIQWIGVLLILGGIVCGNMKLGSPKRKRRIKSVNREKIAH